MKTQISWLFKKPADLDLHCLNGEKRAFQQIKECPSFSRLLLHLCLTFYYLVYKQLAIRTETDNLSPMWDKNRNGISVTNIIVLRTLAKRINLCKIDEATTD